MKTTRAEDLFAEIKKDGEKAIDKLIDDRQSEELFLDFKRSSDNGSGNKMSNSDRSNLAKAISGFGNSEGGIIVWGVNCSSSNNSIDLPDTKHPIIDVKKFISQIESALSGLTLPPHSKVQNTAVLSDDNTSGYVVTYIPQLQASPIQAIFNKHFYIRAGSNFEIIPYQVLAGLFGKKPQPYVYNMYTVGAAKLEDNTVTVQAGFLLHNEGPGIAKDIFINTKVWSSPGQNCQVAFETPDLSSWTGGFSFGRFMSLISKSDLRVAPDAHVQPLILNTTFCRPFTDDLHIKVSCGCAGSPTMKSAIKTSKGKIEKVFKDFVDSNIQWDDDTGHQIAKTLLSRENIDD